MGTGTLITGMWKRSCSSPVCVCNVLAMVALAANNLNIKIHPGQRDIKGKIWNFVPSYTCTLKNDSFRKCCDAELMRVRAVNYPEE